MAGQVHGVLVVCVNGVHRRRPTGPYQRVVTHAGAVDGLEHKSVGRGRRVRVISFTVGTVGLMTGLNWVLPWGPWFRCGWDGWA